MPRVRKISCNPKDKNYYIVDTSFFANKYIPLTCAPNAKCLLQNEIGRSCK